MNHSPILLAQAQQQVEQPATPAAPTTTTGTAQPSQPPPQVSPGALFGPMLPMLILMFAVFYFMTIRPENRKRKEHQKLLDNLKTGDRVITSGGMHGVVSNVKDKTVLVTIADNTKVEFQKGSIQTVLTKDADATDEKSSK